MPVTCKLISGKHRIVGPGGNIEKTADGNPRDGGGHETRAECQRQANAINANLSEGRMSNETKDVQFAIASTFDRVDRAAGIIHGISLAEIGEAEGWGIFIDETTLEQIAEAGNSLPDGLKAKWAHGKNAELGSFLGRYRNFRVDDNATRADLTLSDAAAKSPLGNLKDYVLTLAESDPAAFGASLDVSFNLLRPNTALAGKEGHPPEGDPFWLPHARVSKDEAGQPEIRSADLVDRPAATSGLFSEPDHDFEKTPGFLRCVANACQSWQHKRERKMAEKETQEKLDTALAEVETIKTQLAEKEAAIEGHEAALEKAKADGAEAARVQLAERIEKFKDRDFVLKHTDKSDSEIADEYVKFAQSPEFKLAEGEEAVEGSEGGEDKDKFMDKVHAKMAEGDKMSEGKAIAFCAQEFPKLHEKYNKEMTDQRNEQKDRR